MANLHEGIKGEDWRSMAEGYKKLTVGTSVKPITVMLDKMNAMLPFSQATGIFDSGTGPGQVISRIISDYGPSIPASASLSCSDFSAAMIEQVQKSKAEEIAKDPNSPWNRLEADVKDSMDLQGVPDGSQSHVTAGWVYFMTADPQKCVSESKRVLQPDGVLCCSSWKGSDWMDAVNAVMREVNDTEGPIIPSEWRSVPALEGELQRAGFRDVDAKEVEVEMGFDTYEAMADVLLLKMPMMVKVMQDFSEEEKLTTRRRALEELKRISPTEPGSMRGTALVVIGRK